MTTQRITIDIETDEDPSSILDAAQEIAHKLASRIDGAADDDRVSVQEVETPEARDARRGWREETICPADTRTSPNGPAPDRF